MPDDSKSNATTGKRQTADRVKEDAKGQFRRTNHGKDNSGLASAEPRVLGDGEQEAHGWNENADDQADISLPKREL